MITIFDPLMKKKFETVNYSILKLVFLTISNAILELFHSKPEIYLL